MPSNSRLSAAAEVRSQARLQADVVAADLRGVSDEFDATRALGAGADLFDGVLGAERQDRGFAVGRHHRHQRRRHRRE